LRLNLITISYPRSTRASFFWRCWRDHVMLHHPFYGSRSRHQS